MYAFVDAAAVVDYISHETGVEKINLIGHSMGGMISMYTIIAPLKIITLCVIFNSSSIRALISHPVLHKKISSVTALGSAIYLGNSVCRLLDPFLPGLRLIGGMELQFGTGECFYCTIW